MMITGPFITKPVTVPEHVRHVLDVDAYWNLGFDGEPLAEGAPPTLLYARVAFPTLAAARHQFQLERHALEAQRAPCPRRRAGRKSGEQETGNG
jgi:hypothetical protein